MSDLVEVLISSEVSGIYWTCSAWDPRTGTQLLTYKGGGSAAPHALSFIRNEFLITANHTKPLLHIWPINSQEQIQGIRLVTPGRVTSLAVSPDGCYCVAGVSEHIFIWQICSGRLLASLSRHYQAVTSIRFTDDGSHFISAGQDGMVLVWKLSSVISLHTNDKQQLNPLYSFSDHALPVSDVFVGKGGMRAYMVTASLDGTCKVYDLSTGNLLLTLVFNEPLTAVILDHLDSKIFAGSTNGNIHEFSLLTPPRTKEYHLTDKDIEQKFSGHKGSVSTISLSLDGETLATGGTDENITLWHIASKQIIRTISHKGTITNSMFTLAPRAMFDQEQTLNLIINNFKRMMDTDTTDESDVVEILVTDKEYEEAETVEISERTVNHFDNRLEQSSELNSLRLEVQKLRSINKELFERSLKELLGSVNGNASNNHVCNSNSL